MNKLNKIKDPERREITAPVLVPNEVDYHGHIYSEEEVYKACRNYREKCNKASLQHSFDLPKDASEFVEHYISPADMVFADEEGEETLVKKGAWMATMKFHNDSLWEEVLAKRLKGFSIQATCKSQKVSKAKVAGRAASEEGIKIEKRLFDIDFGGEDHHVALVDEAANATEVLVVKAKHSPDSPVNKPNPESLESVNIVKEETMDLDLEKNKSVELPDDIKTELEELRKSKLEADELKIASDAITAELEELKKAKDDRDAEYLELKKAKDAADMVELVTKAKSFKADDAESFALVLKKCKDSLVSEEYEELCKQLGKITNIAENKELLEDLGEAPKSDLDLAKAKDEKFYELREEHISKGKTPAEASKLARLELEKSE
jgi:hypothetical protein